MPNPLKLDPPNAVDGFEPKTDVVAGVAASPSDVFGNGPPKLNPTGLLNVPLFADPKLANAGSGLAVVTEVAELVPKIPLLPKGLVGGLSETLKGFGLEEDEAPNKLDGGPDINSVLVSESLSLSLSSDEGGLDPVFPKALNADVVSLVAGLVPKDDEGKVPNGDAGFALVPASDEVLGCERESGTVAGEPKADLGGFEGAVEGAVLVVGNEDPDDDELISVFSVDGAGVLPKAEKTEEGTVGGFGGWAPFDDDDDPPSAALIAGADLGLSSKSFCTDIRKFL